MNYYEILGIDKHASAEQIKKAYRKLALKWHPDKNQNNIDVATKKFRDVTEAYDTLSDETKRRNYDMFGRTDAQHININPEEIFKTLFGGQDVFQLFGNNMFDIRIGGGGVRIGGMRNMNQSVRETTSKTTFINNGEVVTKITTTRTYPDGTKNVTDNIVRNKVDASIRDKTPPNTKKKTHF